MIKWLYIYKHTAEDNNTIAGVSTIMNKDIRKRVIAIV